MEDIKASSSPSQALTADDILRADDTESLKVDVPEWNGHVYLCVMTAEEGVELQEEVAKLPANKQTEARYLLLQRTLVDANRRRLFTVEQIDGLKKRNDKVLRRLEDIALRLQGFNDAAAAKNALSGAAHAASPIASRPS